MSKTNSESEQVVTPWTVKGKIDYLKLIEKFGCDAIDGKINKKI